MRRFVLSVLVLPVGLFACWGCSPTCYDKKQDRAIDILRGDVFKNKKDITYLKRRDKHYRKEVHRNIRNIKRNRRKIRANRRMIRSNSAALAVLNDRSNYLERRLGMSEDYALASSAGASAMAVVDFGNVRKGQTQIGVGAGYAHGRFADGSGSSYAGALGLKYGITDRTAVVVKAWVGQHNAYGGGVGVVHILDGADDGN